MSQPSDQSDERPADRLEEFVESNRDVLDLLERVWRGERSLSDVPADTEDATSPVNRLEESTLGNHSISESEDEFSVRVDDLPRNIGRFQIRRLLGQGGFGIVFLAFDPQLKRDVALKIPRPEALLTDELKLRFVREAETAASLNHAGIVPIFEAGSYGLICYIAAGYCQGPSLADWVKQRQKPIPITDTADLAIQLADAVQHAHGRQVIHRDLKPQNILVECDTIESTTREPLHQSSPRLLITDFGLAKSLNETAELTKTHSVVGTPSYMAPEQISNSKSSVGAAADIYSLGAVLYFLLCGHPPFAGKSLLETIKLVEDQPPVGPRKLRKEIPSDLDAICMKCLEKDPRNRYATATDLQSDLIRFQNGLPILARPVSARQRLIRWAYRKPALATSLATLALSIFIALIAISALLWRSEYHRGLAESKSGELAGALANLETRTQDLKAAFDDLFTSIAMTPEIRIPGAESLRKRLLESVNDYYRNLAKEQPGDTAMADYVSAMNRIGDVKLLLNDYEGALEVANQAVAILKSADRNNSEIRQAEIRSQLVFARTYTAMGKRDEFLETSSATIEMARAHYAQVDDQETASIDLARVYTELSFTATRYGHRTLGNQLNQEALTLWQNVDRQNLDDNAAHEFVNAHVEAGLAYASSERSAKAAPLLDLALEVADARLQGPLGQQPAFVSQVARGCRVRGFTLIDDQPAAELHFQKALHLLTGLLDDHPLVPKYSVQIAQLRYQWALAHFISGRHEQAIERLDENLEFVNESIVTFPRVKANLLRNKADTLALTGYALQQLNQLEAARQALQYSRAVNDEIVELTNNSLQARLQLHGVIGGIATIEGQLENLETAIELLNESNAELRAILEDDPDNGECSRYLSGNLGYLRTFYGKMEQWQNALDAFNESMQFDKVFPVEFRRGERASLHMRLGDLQQASDDFQMFCLCPKQDNPERARQNARVAIQFLKTIDVVSKANETSDPAELAALRERALESAIQRLNEMRETPGVEETHWTRLFGDSDEEFSIPEILQWRRQYSL